MAEEEPGMTFGPAKDLARKLAGQSISQPAHRFWDTQPVVRDASTAAERGAPAAAAVADDALFGPIETKTLEDVPKEPQQLPPQLMWADFDVNNPEQLKEAYDLLAEHYVEDSDSMFRFNYSMEFLRWALTAPGWRADWHVTIRARGADGAPGRLLAMVTGIPVQMSVNKRLIPMAEINFLCVHRKLRSKRLAPVLIKEVTRRVNLQNIWQAVYTAGVEIPTPIARCRYFHRSLNPKKLLEVGFSQLAPRMTMARAIKLYALPDAPKTAGLRPLEQRDVPAVTALLTRALDSRLMHPVFDEHEVAHWLLPRAGVVHSWVVAQPDGTITDFASFYALPSTIIGHAKHSVLNAAYSFYAAYNTVSQHQLVNDLLILARKNGFDVFNMLDLMDNKTVFRDLKFGPGDGTLQYYFFNLKCPVLETRDIGMVLL